MKRLIYYPPGCYGTFVNWLCSVNKAVSTQDLPFGDFGNSHKFYNHDVGLISPKHKDLYLRSRRDFGVLRVCWPFNVGVKLINFDNEPDFFYQQCRDDLQRMVALCDKILIIYPDKTSRIWWYQNFCEKVVLPQHIVNKHLEKKDWSWLIVHDPVTRARHHMDLQKDFVQYSEFYQKFNKVSALEFELYELRQIMAWELAGQTLDDYQCWEKLIQDFPQIQFVSLKQLRDQFKEVMLAVFEYFEIASKAVESFDFIETEWSIRQTHRFKDQTVDSIVNAILHKQPMDWQDKNLNFFDEVYIEKILHYEHGIELSPYNFWPSNAEEFLRMVR